MARKSAVAVMKDYKERKIQIQENIRKAMLKKQKDREEKEKRKEKENKSNLIKEIQKYSGEWTSREDVIFNLKKINNDSSKRTALVTQLKFQKFVLGAKTDDKSKFQQQSKGKVFSVEELTENLIHILDFNRAENETEPSESSISGLAVEAQRKNNLEKIKSSIKKSLDDLKLRNLAKQSTRSEKSIRPNKPKKKKREKVLQKVARIKSSDLVGKTVEHLFDDEEDTDLTVSYVGTVTRV